MVTLVIKAVINARRSQREVYFLFCFHESHSLQIFGELPNRKFHEESIFPYKQTDKQTHKNADMTKPMAALPLFEILQTRLKIIGGLIKFQPVVPIHCGRRISECL